MIELNPVARLTRFTSRPKYLIYGPLSQTSLDPDVVLLFIRPDQTVIVSPGLLNVAVKQIAPIDAIDAQNVAPWGARFEGGSDSIWGMFGLSGHREPIFRCKPSTFKIALIGQNDAQRAHFGLNRALFSK
jgi:hypothetical protein